MGIILKFMLRNIKEKKLRTFLVVFSIMASTALFFASSGMSTSIKQTYVDIIRQYYGNADIEIHSNSKSPTPYLSMERTDTVKSKTDYAIGEMDANGVYTHGDKDRNIMLRGFNYDDIKLMDLFDFNSKGSVTPFSGEKVIISKKSADEYGFSVGDKIPIKVGKDSISHKYTIVGIADNKGMFGMESDENMMAIIPRQQAENINNIKGEVSLIYIKASNSNDIKQIVDELTPAYNHYTVRKIIDEKQIDESLGQITMAFRMMMIVVLMMSAFIIYTVFKVIVTERLPVIGTFRSIGATKISTSLVLVGESIIYGIIGGILGNLAGIGILKVLMKLIASQMAQGITIAPSVSYNFGQLLSAFIFSIIISFLSSIVPIAKSSRLSVKDVVLNTIDNAEKEKLWKLILGLVFVAGAFSTPNAIKGSSLNSSTSLMILVVCMVLSVIGIVIIIPYVTELLVIILSKLYNIIFGNEGSLAAKNLRKNKSLINNISLLAIGISTLFMINVVSSSAGTVLVKAYDFFNYDLYVNNDDGNSLDNSTISDVKNTVGIKEVDEDYSSQNIEVIGNKEPITQIRFMNTYEIDNFAKVKMLQDKNEVFKNYNDGRTIILTKSNMKRYNKQIGNYITIKTTRGNKDYKIVGSFDTMMEDGNMALVPKKYAKGDFKLYQCSSLDIKTYKDPEEMKNVLSKRFKTRRLTIETVAHQEEENKKQNDGMLLIIKAFPIMALIIGAFGVINNFVISFIERKRSLAVYASVGMSRHQTRKMLFVESLLIGLIGSLCGIAGGMLMIYIMPFMFDLANFPMELNYSSSVFGTSILLGVLITVVAAIVPSLKSSKLNIIEAIKYE
ncbi:ABC transporter permease [Clostridium guangxiense]|uniref:ABC transporter permease n=2 Tax=Clostridium TaxID=1485 RepID=UPI001E45BE60|nr:FtsX-like permease family protein [Clostridium guangxiense]MCD2346354.1 ABC transporter permease [Clostridium guangxiense]